MITFEILEKYFRPLYLKSCQRLKVIDFFNHYRNSFFIRNIFFFNFQLIPFLEKTILIYLKRWIPAQILQT